MNVFTIRYTLFNFLNFQCKSVCNLPFHSFMICTYIYITNVKSNFYETTSSDLDEKQFSGSELTTRLCQIMTSGWLANFIGLQVWFKNVSYFVTDWSLFIPFLLFYDHRIRYDHNWKGRDYSTFLSRNCISDTFHTCLSKSNWHSTCIMLCLISEKYFIKVASDENVQYIQTIELHE